MDTRKMNRDYQQITIGGLLGEVETEPEKSASVSDRESVYTRVVTLCAQHSITVAELERRLGLSKTSVRKWKKSVPSADNLKKTADILGVSMEYLLLGYEEESAFTRTEIRPALAAFVETASTLDDETLFMLTALIKKMNVRES